MGFFTVTMRTNNRYPDVVSLCLKQDWAKGLCYSDIEGFAIGEEGNLYLLDECGNYREVPYGKFKVLSDPDEKVEACPFCGKNDLEIITVGADEPSGIVEKHGADHGIVCACKSCGARGPIIPVVEDDDQESTESLMNIMWNMALRIPKYERKRNKIRRNAKFI